MAPSIYSGKHRSAQGSVEFMVIISIVGLIFIVVLFIITQKWQESNDFMTFIDAKKVANTLSTNINNLAQQGHGYWRSFYLPPRVNGYDYNISVTENNVLVEWQDQNYVMPIVTKKVDVISLTKGDYNCVMNVNETVYITDRCIEVCAIKFLEGSQNASQGSNVRFEIMNTANYTQTIASMRAAWNNPNAFLHKVSLPEGSVIWDGDASPVASGINVDVIDTTAHPIEILRAKLQFWDSSNQNIDMNGTQISVFITLDNSAECDSFSFAV